MKKKTIIRLLYIMIWLALLSIVSLSGQEQHLNPSAPKAGSKAADINAASERLLQESRELTGNVQQAVQNVKTVVQIFEPILRLKLRKSKKPGTEPFSGRPTETTPEVPVTSGTDSLNANKEQAAEESIVHSAQEDYIDPQVVSPYYNPDGTANLGNQNHTQFGSYLDVLNGTIMDDIDAAGQSGSIDLIFTATDYFGSAPMYALLTPSYAKNDPFAYHFFKGARFKDRNIPPALWDQSNESEIALCPISGPQFEKIRDNNQLMAVIKQCGGFKDRYESRVKMDGKVFAIKTEMGNRTAYGLIHVINQYGTTGENGYLRIKLKVTGVDGNGDGLPDAGQYIRN